MPVITFETLQINKAQKQQLVKEFTESAAKITGIPESGFYVFIKENDTFPEPYLKIGRQLVKRAGISSRQYPDVFRADCAM